MAEEPELCESFMDGRVDETLLAGMLSAAEDGHLYRIEPGSSQVGFCANSRLSRIEGQFTDFQGGMALGHGTTGDGQTLVLIRTASLDTRGGLVRSLLMGENFFDVERYPDVLFISRDFSWTSERAGVMTGDLTMRGITRPVSFDVILTPADKGLLTVKATATIDRAQFGMDKLDSLVNGEVQLCLSVAARRYQQPLASRADSGRLAAEMVTPVPGRGDDLPG